MLRRDRYRSRSRSGPFDVTLDAGDGGRMSNEELAAWKVVHIVEQLLNMKQEYMGY